MRPPWAAGTARRPTDVSKDIARLDGPFEPGISGWAKQRGDLGGLLHHHGRGGRAALGHRMPGAVESLTALQRQLSLQRAEP
jgi:hypothetical protein